MRGLRPRLSPAEITEVRSLLREHEVTLFLGAEARDQRHSVDLLHRLRAQSYERGEPVSSEMQVAALLHDVGKGPLRTWHRVAFVILAATSSRLLTRLIAERGAGWRRALWRLRHHARLGADRLRQAECDARVIAIVAAHTDPPPTGDAEIAWFIAADDEV